MKERTQLCKSCGLPADATIHTGGHPERCHAFVRAPRERPIMKCHAKGCDRQIASDRTICDTCAAELEALMKAGLAEQLGHQPTDAEFDAFLSRIETSRKDRQ